MYCRGLERLLDCIVKLGSPYKVVEKVLEYPRHMEVLSLVEVGSLVECDKVCLMVKLLEERLRDRRVCVVLPGINEGKVLSHVKECEEVIVAETALRLSLELGIRPLLTVTDLDGPDDLLTLYHLLSDVVAVHVHGDNLYEVKHFARRAFNTIYTSQIGSYRCVIGPLGFTDGDRATIIPMLMRSKEITVIGFDLERPKGKRLDKKEKLVKIGLGYLIVHYYASRLGYKVSEDEGLLKILKR